MGNCFVFLSLFTVQLLFSFRSVVVVVLVINGTSSRRAASLCLSCVLLYSGFSFLFGTLLFSAFDSLFPFCQFLFC